MPAQEDRPPAAASSNGVAAKPLGRANIARISLPGVVLGTLFFAASLTPSLAPRPATLLGLVGGIGFSMGYLSGTALLHFWRYMGLPVRRLPRRLAQTILALCAGLAAACLWMSIDWQNDVRIVLHMAPLPRRQLVETSFFAVLAAAIIFVLLLGIAALFRRLTSWLERYLPRRVTIPLGAVLVALLVWGVTSGIVFRAGLHLADASFRELDALIEPDIKPPAHPLQTGSSESLIAWEDLGRQGRHYITSGPTREQIGLLAGAEARQPVRVYAGLTSAGNVEARASLALEELKRAGGFEKSVLLVIAPTGTGWIDPAAIDSLEYLHRGDVASVAVQYSYMASWLSLLVEPDYGSQSARALFDRVYGYWKTLSPNRRPRLYLYGLSLGALSSESSLNLFDMMDDPIQGALWAGPPFASRLWQSTTRERQPGSPYWLPRFRDGSVVRFTNQQDHLTDPGRRWGPMRIVYLQYGSDPITFFSPASLYRKPEWMSGPRAPDVSPTFRWLPGVTFLQLSVDMIGGMHTPPGTGHVFAADHYIDAWIAVTQPTGWTETGVDRLRQKLSRDQNQDLSPP